MGYVEKNLGPGETVVYRARYHWIAYKTALLLLFLSFLLGLAALYALKVSPEGETMSRITTVMVVMALAFLGFALLAFAIRWVRASADAYAVTSRRVIRKYGLLSREVEQALLEKIQDITIRQGFIARLLGYGTVVVETASETGRMVFPDIADPEALRTALWGQASSPAAPATPSAGEGPAARERLAELEELKGRGLLSPEEYSSKRQEILSSL